MVTQHPHIETGITIEPWNNYEDRNTTELANAHIGIDPAINNTGYTTTNIISRNDNDNDHGATYINADAGRRIDITIGTTTGRIINNNRNIPIRIDNSTTVFDNSYNTIRLDNIMRDTDIDDVIDNENNIYWKALNNSNSNFKDEETEHQIDIKSVIALQLTDGTYKCIKLFHRGNIKWCGRLLYQYYNRYSKVFELVSKGNLDHLSLKIDNCSSLYIDSVSVEHAPVIFKDLSSIRKIIADFYYVYSGNYWKVCIGGRSNYTSLEDVLIYNDIISVRQANRERIQQQTEDENLI